MKNTSFRYIYFIGFVLFFVACSTKRNTFLSRNSHALSTKYNILYNGGLALDQGIMEVKDLNYDNFWERLPIERMQLKEETGMPTEARNASFERAETKAIKSIQKHSMYIQGSEKNPQMDEAHLLLGKARYYDQRFVPALEAFNYVLNKYPKSNKIYEVKIWREKTNMRLDNDAIAVKNLRKLLEEIKFKDQIYADANAALAQAFLNLEQKDSAIARIKIAIEFTKSSEEESRYRYILGQIFEEIGEKDSAYVAYQSVIDMKRRAGRQYVIHSHIQHAKQFDYEQGDTIAFISKYNELLEDRENRPYLDVLDHQMAIFYDKKKNYTQAKSFYNYSLRDNSKDEYLIASNYRNLADIYFDEAKYIVAGKYFDSTLVHLKPRTREFNLIKKKRENLDDVIKYEGIANKNDSILALYKMSEVERRIYFEDYIVDLKAKDAAKNAKAAEEAKIKESQALNDAANTSDQAPKLPIQMPGASNFYFYNPSTVEYGKKQFIKIWGKRNPNDFWRISTQKGNNIQNDNEVEKGISSDDQKDNKENAANKPKGEEPKYTPEFYIKKIPKSKEAVDELIKDRNFAYYQLGVIYKEKFKEYELAVDKLERLLNNDPEEKLVLPTMYNLYKLYLILDKNKAEVMKAKIINGYPDSRYAQILNNPNAEALESTDSPTAVYKSLYTEYDNGELKTVLPKTEMAIERFNGDEIVPKIELLRAHIIGKLKGLAEYKNALNYVALNYPNSEEGKLADKLIKENLPKLEALELGAYPSIHWKILYSTTDFDSKETKALRDKITKFTKDRSLDKLIVSLDIYTMTDNFVVIHGINSEDVAKGIASILKEYKDYMIPNKAIVISAENYAIVQIKKNIEDYLAGKISDTPKEPNWDGTIEKAPETKPKEKVQPQAKPQVPAKKPTIPSTLPNQPNNFGPNKTQNNNMGNFGPPSAPQTKSQFSNK